MSEKKYSVTTTGPRLDGFLKPILRDGGFDLKYQITDGVNPHPDIENPEITVQFSGADVDLLLSNKAELLLALEQLAMETLRMPAEDHSLLCFDANDYRILRIEELRVSAVTAAEKVKKSRVPFHFNPMSSRERRIIHLALRNETTLRSESIGTGPYRQVVIIPADMPTPPEPPRTYRDIPRRDSGPDRRPGGDRGSRPPRRDRRG